jgi:hypothetical protein
MLSIDSSLKEKEAEVEQFVKDLLGGNLYECERKLKDAEASIDKMAKKIIELNNNMNDFDIDVKNGLHTNPNDQEVVKTGKHF